MRTLIFLLCLGACALAQNRPIVNPKLTGTLDLSLVSDASKEATRDTLGLSQTTFKIKAADTSRTATTTLASDPDLSQSLTEGTYTVEVVMAFVCATGAPGHKWAMNAAGGSVTLATGLATKGANAAEPNVHFFPNGSAADILDEVFSMGDTGFGYARFSIVVATTTTLSVQWAQSVSDAAAVALKAGSYMKISREP